MKWILCLYSQSLRLYPRSLRARFAKEMQEVFQAGLGEVNAKGVVVDFIMRELLRLPANLIGVYMWSMRSGVGKQVAVSGMGGGGTAGVSLPGES